MISIASEYIGYVSIIAGAIFGAYKFILPFFLGYKEKRRVLSVPNINYIKDTATRALVKSQILIDNSKTMIYTCTPDGRCVYSSKELSFLFNKTPEEMLGYGWTLSVIAEDRDNSLQKWISCVKEGRPYQDSYRIDSGHGQKTIWTSAQVCFNYDAEEKKFTDEILFYVGTVKVVG